MGYLLPSIGDFKAQFARDFPYATPLAPKGVSGASLVAVLSASGTVSSLTVTATTTSSAATVTVGGVAVTSGAARGPASWQARW